jgi:hypothetical protein
MTNPEILIGDEIREMTDDEAKNYLQIIADYPNANGADNE